MILPVLDKSSNAYKRARKIADQDGWDSRWIVSEQDVSAVLDYGCWFNSDAGQSTCDWIETYLTLWEGRKWSGKPFLLWPFQREHIVMPLFGWMDKRGYRRYQQSFIEMAKKNGKSPLSSALMIYLWAGDGEPGAQVLCAATNEDQAKIVYGHCRTMIEASKALSKRTIIRESPIQMKWMPTNSVIKPLSKDFGSKEGLNIHGLVYDEFHAVKDARLWTALKYGGIDRLQPLYVIITTAGESMETLWGEEHTTAVDILKARKMNYRYHAFVCCPEDYEADPADEETWKAANPALGHTVGVEEMRNSCEAAKGKTRDWAAWKRYRCNIPAQVEERWMDPLKWTACKREIDWARYKGKPCWGGIDLSSHIDLTAFALLFEPVGTQGSDARWAIQVWFWIPEKRLLERVETDRVRYDVWKEQGWIKTTPGDAIDTRFIRRDINAIIEDGGYSVQSIGFDPKKMIEAAGLMIEEDGLDMVEVSQAISEIGGPFAWFEEKILRQEIIHDGNPVLAWNHANTAIREDQNGNRKPDKRHSVERIDGIDAALDAISLALRAEPKRESVYETRGLIEL